MQPTLFRSIDLSTSDSTWTTLFQAFWPAYRSWFIGKKGALVNHKELAWAEQQLEQHMPELMPIYRKLVRLTGNDPVAAQFLTMYRPPAYLINCSQAVLQVEEPMLIRNYDLSPELSENTITHSNWLGRKVIATNECLWGADDGMNDAGLALSLTFGGNQQVGDGFGIPLIMRYILETCTTVQQAIAVFKRIPSHMAYNVTIVDAQGDFATLMVGLEGNIHVTRERAITNHQQQVVWPQQAQFSKTIERKQFLDDFLQRPTCTSEALIAAFLQAPLRSTQYDQSFGTVYTAVYQPQSGRMRYVWPDREWSHSFDDFKDGDLSVQLLSTPMTACTSNATDAHTHMTEVMRDILQSMLHHINPALLPNPQVSIQLNEALQSQNYEWIQFTNDFARIWTTPHVQPNSVKESPIHPTQQIDVKPVEAPQTRHPKPKRVAIAFH